MTEERFEEFLMRGETSNIEFKRCGNGMEDDLYETVCSFSNKFGGDIFCGVLDNGIVNGLPEKAVSSMIKNFISVLENQQLMSPTLCIEPEVFHYKDKVLIHIHVPVPVSAEVHSYKSVIYDRVGDSDIRTVSTSNIADMYIRKKNIFTEQKVYEYVELEDLRSDLIDVCRQRAINKRTDHSWKNLSDMDMLKSAKLYGKDYETGKKGFNLAAILLLGKDEVIGSVCPAYKTDALLRKVNVDRYDDREIVQTNLIESYDRLIEFARKNLWDKFFMEETQTVSIRDKIVREMISNTLMHREFTSSYIAKFVIENNRMFVENACRAAKQEELTPENFTPVSKNPIIASFFTTIGNADELGSGTRNLFKYTKLYSGLNPKIIEDDIFRIIVPLNENYSFDYNIGNNIKTGNDNKKIYLSESQKKIIAEMQVNPKTTAEKLSAIIGISQRKIEENIHFLKDCGRIGRVGSNKNGEWVVFNIKKE